MPALISIDLPCCLLHIAPLTSLALSTLCHNFSRTLSFAERLRGFEAASCSWASTGRFVMICATAVRLSLELSMLSSCHLGPCCSSSGVARPAALRKAHLTALSSREWKEMIARRPPGASASIASGIAASRAPSSSFTAMRSAYSKATQMSC